MSLFGAITSFVTSMADKFRPEKTALAVDALEDKGRRKAPQLLLRSEDDDIGPHTRRGQLITLGRDIRRNYSIAAWAIRKHIDYVSSFSFQAQTGDPVLNRRLEELVQYAGRVGKFEVTRRHGLRRYLRLAEAARTTDGDILTVFLGSGMVQGIEADRLRTPISYGKDAAPIAPDVLNRMYQGVVLADSGEAEAFAVSKRGPSTRSGPDIIMPANLFTFERLVPARNAMLLAYHDRLDQVRGNSPIISALNSFRDTYENFDYATAKAKVSQLFALAILRKAAGSLGPTETSEGGKIDIDFNRGPVLLDLDPDEDVKVVESGQPSDQWQSFMNMLVASSLASLDIPFCFYDATKTNYSQYRGAALQYEQSAQQKREDLKELLDRWTAWRMAIFAFYGILELPAGIEISNLKWDWVSTGVPWIDPLKEVQADGFAVDRGFDSTVGICRSMGRDAYQIAEEQARYEAHRATLNLRPQGPLAPQQIIDVPDSEDDSVD
jgi:capsid protein